MDAEEAAIEDEKLMDRLPIIEVVIMLGIRIRKTLPIESRTKIQGFPVLSTMMKIMLHSSVRIY